MRAALLAALLLIAACDPKRDDCEALAPSIQGVAEIDRLAAKLTDPSEHVKVGAAREIADRADVFVAELSHVTVRSTPLQPKVAGVVAVAREVSKAGRSVGTAADALATSQKKLASIDVTKAPIQKTYDAGEKVAIHCMKKLAGCPRVLELMQTASEKSDAAEFEKLASQFDAVTVDDAGLRDEVKALAASLRAEGDLLKALRDLKAELKAGIDAEDAAFVDVGSKEKSLSEKAADLTAACGGNR